MQMCSDVFSFSILSIWYLSYILDFKLFRNSSLTSPTAVLVKKLKASFLQTE